MLTIGIAVGQHLAFFPDRLIVQIYICFALVVSIFFTAIAKHLRAGRDIPGSSNRLGIIDIDIDDELMAAHVAVVDVQRSLRDPCDRREVGIHGAVFKINRHIIARIRVTINIYGFTFGIECAIFESARVSCIGPQRIICFADSRLCCAGGIEGNIVKCSRCIAPVIRTPIENTIFQRDIMDTNVAL